MIVTLALRATSVAGTHVDLAHRLAFAQALAGRLADQLVGVRDQVAAAGILADLGELDVLGADRLAGRDRAAKDRKAGRREDAALDVDALGAGMIAAGRQRGREAARGAVVLDLPDVDIGGRVERQRDREAAAAEIDVVGGAHAFVDEGAAKGRQDVAEIEGLAHAFDQHAIEAGLRAPGEAVGARDFHQLLDLDRQATAGGRRAEHGAVVGDALEDVRQLHEVAFDHDQIRAQALRRGGAGGRDDRGEDEGDEQGERLHGAYSRNLVHQRSWLTTFSIWSEAWMTFEFIS